MLMFKHFALLIFERALSTIDDKEITAKFVVIKSSKNMLQTKELDWIIINNKFNNPFHATGLFPYPLKTSEK